MRLLFVILVVGAALGGCGDAAANSDSLRVIVNAKNPATKVSKQFVADAFLKKRTRWGGDSPIKPVDLGQKHSVRSRFSRSLLDRDVAAVRRYWAQLVFSGRGVPPPEVTDEEEVISYVANNPGAIGYVSAGATLSGVKAVSIE
jgi:ABC-type phosphate transport system substrate-binding protein